MNTKCKRWMALAAISAAVGLAPSAWAADRAVCPTGCAYATIQSAIDAAAHGDTVRVRPGTYLEAIDISKPIMVRSSRGAAKTIIDASGSNRSAVRIGYSATLQGFTVRGGVGDVGGGIHVTAGNATIHNNTIRNNRATRGGGGAWVNSYANGLFSNNRFIANEAGANGGGVTTAEYARVELNNNQFNRNTATMGGAVFASSYATTIVTGNTLRNNTAQMGGGAAFDSYSARSHNVSRVRTLVFERNVVRDNVAAVDGGGLLIGAYSFAVPANNVIVRNHAQRGGGVYMQEYSGGSVVNCTVADNSATTVGGIGIGEYGGARVINTVVWNNGNGQVAASPSIERVAYSNVQGGYPGTGNVSGDPRFVDAAALDYRIGAGSAAIDRGRDVSVEFGVTSDFAGATRPIDGDGAGAGSTGDGSDVDMGAYEVNPPPLACGFSDNGDGTVTDTRTGLMWVQDANGVGSDAWSSAQSRASGVTTGGYNDWRLPTIDELTALYANLSVGGTFDAAPFVNLAVDGATDWHWSSTLSDPGCNAAWYCHAAYFDFQQGFPSTLYITARLWVLPVRTSNESVCTP